MREIGMGHIIEYILENTVLVIMPRQSRHKLERATAVGDLR
jgi:hypothetical protein